MRAGPTPPSSAMVVFTRPVTAICICGSAAGQRTSRVGGSAQARAQGSLTTSTASSSTMSPVPLARPPTAPPAHRAPVWRRRRRTRSLWSAPPSSSTARRRSARRARGRTASGCALPAHRRSTAAQQRAKRAVRSLGVRRRQHLRCAVRCAAQHSTLNHVTPTPRTDHRTHLRCAELLDVGHALDAQLHLRGALVQLQRRAMGRQAGGAGAAGVRQGRAGQESGKAGGQQPDSSA